MKILFVYRGFGPSLKNPVVDAQANSLVEAGIEIVSFPIQNGGFEYFKSLFKIRRLIKKNNFDLVHGHYSYSAIIAYFAHSKKTIASLMVGDIDPQTQNIILRKIALFFSNYIWSKTIVKSERMKKMIPNSTVIPNGINFDIFKFIDKKTAIKKVGFKKRVNIIFLAQQPEKHTWKNLGLAKKAVKLLNNKDVELHVLKDIPQKELYYYYCAADLMLQTSSLEGSPNIIKEAMACNCPIVTTDCGDSKKNVEFTEGCYIISFDVNDIVEKIKLALAFGKRTKGRKDIRHLESKNISQKVIKLYKSVLEK
ncbi:MAG: glycosyl transferase group 1 [Candidatus Marinimicrobia bacterium]|nr:glycosyl transferase group 1 [Candidatus Neomarinimicrobiota bacterium]|tara:strand:- start:404 stop:1330 length:927 start_codon:yes stop_codon:yes gene_type:complete